MDVNFQLKIYPMQTQTPGSRAVLSQKENNTTIWIGHLAADPNDHVAGQTFICPSDGNVHSIRLYSAAVQQEGHLHLTLHTFDPSTKTWSAPLAEVERYLDRSDASRWIDFPLPPPGNRSDPTSGGTSARAERKVRS